jgi:hypothetical protein
MISRECYWALSCGVLLFLSGPFFICQCTLLHFELAMKLRFFLPVFSTLFPSLPLVVVLICKNFGHPARWRGYVRSTTNRNLYKTPSLSLNTSHNSEEFVGDPSRHLKTIHECQRASMMELPIADVRQAEQIGIVSSHQFLHNCADAVKALVAIHTIETKFTNIVQYRQLYIMLRK